ncbi:hypothetical protein, partial [Mycobacterium tuberculosis]
EGFASELYWSFLGGFRRISLVCRRRFHRFLSHVEFGIRYMRLLGGERVLIGFDRSLVPIFAVLEALV